MSIHKYDCSHLPSASVPGQETAGEAGTNLSPPDTPATAGSACNAGKGGLNHPRDRFLFVIDFSLWRGISSQEPDEIPIRDSTHGSIE